MLKLIMVDLDGTLFDTREVNYLAYREAMAPWGYQMDYTYYCESCDGHYYLDFLPSITTDDQQQLTEIHERKKELYRNFLSVARPNNALISLLTICHGSCKVALVTTASNRNAHDILDRFGITTLFDLILAGDEVKRAKPDPEGYLKAMAYFGVTAEESVIFEDSDIGFSAARQAGVACFAVKGLFE